MSHSDRDQNQQRIRGDEWHGGPATKGGRRQPQIDDDIENRS